MGGSAKQMLEKNQSMTETFDSLKPHLSGHADNTRQSPVWNEVNLTSFYCEFRRGTHKPCLVE